jgi:heme oxygenase (biliverdin-IX-beta and delta-forming)
METNTASFLDRLKTQTRCSHLAIESRLAVMHPDLTLAQYRATLASFHGFYAPVEQALEVTCLPGLDWNGRAKLGWLAADLQTLGIRRPSDLPPCSRLPAMTTVAQCFGCLYVLEGATLGARVISRHLREVLGIEERSGGRFFHGYGEHTGAMWQGTRRALDEFADSEERQRQVVASALDTFTLLGHWLEQGSDR